MNLINEIKQSYYNANECLNKIIVENAQTLGAISILFKVAAFALSCFASFQPLILGICGFSFFACSLLIDAKLLYNVGDIILALCKNSKNDSYKNGFFMGRMWVHSKTIPWLWGFGAGYIHEYFRH